MSAVKRFLKVLSNMFKSILGFECVSRTTVLPGDGLSVGRDTIAVHNLATDGPLVYEACVGTMPVMSNASTAAYREIPYYAVVNDNTGQIDHNASWAQQGYLSDHRFYHLTTGQVIRIDKLDFYDGPGTAPYGGGFGSNRLRLQIDFSTRQNRRTQAPFGESNNTYFRPNNPNSSANVAAGLNFKPINKVVVDFPYDERTEVLEYTLADSANFNDYGSIYLYDDTNALQMGSSNLLNGGVPHDHGTNTEGHTRPYRVTIT